MIVITSENKNESHFALVGSMFNLTITSDLLPKPVTVISEEIKEATIIDYFCSFRFTDDTGTCLSSHFCGFFGNFKNLPEEIKNAPLMADLPSKQFKNFITSFNAKI